MGGERDESGEGRKRGKEGKDGSSEKRGRRGSFKWNKAQSLWDHIIIIIIILNLKLRFTL